MPTKEIETSAYIGRGEDDDATKTRRAKKKTKSRRVPFLSNEFDALKASKAFFVRVKSSSSGESWKARARVWRKKYCGEIVSPHSHKKKEKKISLLVVFLPLFCPFFGALFFIASLFFSVSFSSFLAGREIFYRV